MFKDKVLLILDQSNELICLDINNIPENLLTENLDSTIKNIISPNILQTIDNTYIYIEECTSIDLLNHLRRKLK